MKIADRIRKGKFRGEIMVLGLACFAVIGMHPFYISVTDVEVFPEEELIGITIKVFTDDLEAVLVERGVNTLSLGAPEEHSMSDTYIARYLDEVINWTVNGQARTAAFLGKEVELDVTYLYLEITEISSLEQLEVSHKLFIEELETQQNIVHLHCQGGVSSKRLDLRFYQATLVCE